MVEGRGVCLTSTPPAYALTSGERTGAALQANGYDALEASSSGRFIRRFCNRRLAPGCDLLYVTDVPLLTLQDISHTVKMQIHGR